MSDKSQNDDLKTQDGGPTKSEKPKAEKPKAEKPEAEQDLTTFLSDSQCTDLTLLVATVTERMRRSIEENFDPYATLNEDFVANLNKSEDEKIMNPDIDPAKADVHAFEKERNLLALREKEVSAPSVTKLREDTLKFYDEWRKAVVKRVGEVVNSKQDAEQQISDAAENYEAPLKPQSAPKDSSLKEGDTEKKAPKLDDIFPRVKTPLTKLSISTRSLILHSLLLLLLSQEHYSARSRVLLLYITSSLKLSINKLQEDEEKIAKGLLESAQQINADKESQEKVAASQSSRKWKIAAATAAGAAVVGVTGGMAAPMVASGVGAVMGGLGLGTTAAAEYLGAVAGSTYLVGGLFGAYGGRMTGQMMDNLSREVEDFAFLPVHGRRKEFNDDIEAAEEERRLRVTIGITGWLTEKEEIVKPWRVLSTGSEVFALRWELENLMNLGNSINTMLSSAAWGYAQSQVIGQTMFAELMSSMIWPMGVVKVARVVDNPFTLGKTRADKAGEVLADALINKAQGERSVTLIGYSLGARVIYSCLTSLAKRNAFGLIENAILIGAPTPSDTSSWRTMRTACTGRLINVYSTNDRILAFLYRTSSIQLGVAGLAPIEGLFGVENVDVSETVSGHLRYRYLIGKILQRIGLQNIDKEEIKVEEAAFNRMVEEEKEQDYIRQAKEKSQKYLGKTEVSDMDADKEVGNMEKEIEKKNEKSMMQWATEQLYISRSSASDPDQVAGLSSKALKSGANALDDAAVAGSKASKGYYQRAKESLYLSRSGSKNENLAKQGISEVGPSYLQQAALYAYRYLPSWHSKTSEVTNTAKGVTGSVTGESSSYLASAASYLPSWPSSQPKPPKSGTEKASNVAENASDIQQATTDKTGELSKEVVQDVGGTTVQNASTTVGSGVKGTTDMVGSGQKKAFDTAGAPEAAGESGEKVLDAVGQTGTNAGETLGKGAKGGLDKVGEGAETGVSGAGKAPEQVGKGAKAAGDAVTGAAGSLGDATGAKKGAEKMTKAADSAGNAVGADKAKETVGGAAQSTSDAATGAAGQAGEAASGATSQVTGALKGGVPNKLRFG